MEQIINKFDSKYSRITARIIGLNPDYPLELKIKIAVSVSVLMSKLDNGDYNHLRKKSSTKLPDEVIDMFGDTYIKNYCKVADTIYQAMGNYDTFPKIETLQPDNFIKKLISQVNNL